MPNIYDNEELYGVITLNGNVSPGKVTLSGHARRVNWNVQNGFALEGASVFYKNTPPIEFTCTFQLVKDPSQGIDDFAGWDAFVKVINSTVAGTKPKALDIYHPDLAANDIKAVVKAEVGGMTYDGRGGATIAVKFQEYRVPKFKSGAPKSAPAVDPHAVMKAELAELTKRYQQTPTSLGVNLGPLKF